VLKLSVEIDTSLSERLVQFSRVIFAPKKKISWSSFVFISEYC